MKPTLVLTLDSISRESIAGSSCFKGESGTLNGRGVENLEGRGIYGKPTP